MTGVIMCGIGQQAETDGGMLPGSRRERLQRIRAAVCGLFPELILVTDSPLDYADQDIESVTEVIPGKGAMGGIYSGLFYASHDAVFVFSCDLAASIDLALVSHMIRRFEKYDAVVPRTSKGFQPLHAIYSQRCSNKLEKQIRENRLSLEEFFKTIKVLEIAADTAVTSDK